MGFLLEGCLTEKNQWGKSIIQLNVLLTFLIVENFRNKLVKKEGKHNLCLRCPLRGQWTPTTTSRIDYLPSPTNKLKPLQLLTLTP